ncbi:amidase signature domain-containing protein, partial [Mycena galopus ATCC 62051]
YVKWIGNYAEADCVLVEILYECGAVPFVRTNVPQTLMWGETMNHVFGRSLNPYNLAFTPGGSSGGEGALLAMKGSPLGVGTDIGGSLRIPSSFCGLYTLRPCYGRLPYSGAMNALEGQESISSVLGPMANSISGVKIFTKAVLDAEPWRKDPLCLRKGWNEAEYKLKNHGEGGRMCFAIMWDNGVVKPHPPLHRAMKLTKQALEAAGHEVIDWEPHRHLEIYKNAETIFAADGGHDYRQQCEGFEPLIQTMSPSTDKHENALDEPLLWQLHTEKRELRKSHLTTGWRGGANGEGRPVDAIIGRGGGLNTDSFYTTLCNALDYACSVFPVTVVDPEVDDPHPPHHNSDLFPGCPEEEAVIGMTEVVVDALAKLNEDGTPSPPKSEL